MSTLKATYTSNDLNEVIETTLDTTKPLTDSIVALQGQINAFLTSKLEQEKVAKETPVSTVEQDEAEEEQKEMKAAEEEEEGITQESEEMEVEDKDSPMAEDRPEVDDKQNVKKQKTDV
jgi:hypothetical protein